jgi:hypothetical protein
MHGVFSSAFAMPISLKRKARCPLRFEREVPTVLFRVMRAEPRHCAFDSRNEVAST